MGLLDVLTKSDDEKKLKRLESVRVQAQDNYLLLKERIAELELSLEDVGWLRLGDETLDEFSRNGLGVIARLGRLFYLKNPLVQRGVNVQKYYVWGQGMEVVAKDDEINEVLQDFLKDEKNRAELTSNQARMSKEVELQTDGNLFFVLFTNVATGRVRIRSISFGEIWDVVRNPEDSKEPWYYHRIYSKQEFDATGGLKALTQIEEYFPDWRFRPKDKPSTINKKPVHWDRPVYHVKVGGFSDWKFGVSEVYAAIDWARAYKEFLEDWASIVRAYSRFAFKMTGMKSTAEIAAAKARLDSTAFEGGTGEERVPGPTPGSTAFLREERDLQPIKTAGATVAAEDGRRLLLMVAAAVGLPETFFGDVSVGTLATAKSLDRPTELQMKDRQTLWTDVHVELFNYVLLQQLKATSGELKGKGKVEVEEEDGKVEERIVWADSTDSLIDIDFPPIIERDLENHINSIVAAATLKGVPQAGTFLSKELSRMLMVGLGEKNIDERLELLYPEDEGEEDDEDEDKELVPIGFEDEQVADAINGFRRSMEHLVEKHATADR